MEILEIMKNIKIDYNKGFGYFNSNGDAPYKTWKDFILAVIYDKKYKIYDNDMMKNGFLEKTIDRKSTRLNSSQLNILFYYYLEHCMIQNLHESNNFFHLQ